MHFDYDLLRYLEGFVSEERKQRFIEVLSKRTRFLTVAIEDVYQLHNTSAVIRSCDAFGVQNVHVVEERYGKRLDKDIAMGAEQWIDVHRYKTTKDCITKLKKDGYQIIATTPHNNSNLLSDFKVTSKTALFFGTERDGLSEAVLQKADGFLKIPMVGFSESLNISVSAAIMIQELSDDLRKSKLPWWLTELEVLEKKLAWTKKSINDVEGIMGRYFE